MKMSYMGHILRDYNTGKDLLISQVHGTNGNVTTASVSGRLYLQQ